MRAAYAAFDYNRVVAALTAFLTSDLSAFYFDVRKDALYCDPLSSVTRKSALTVVDAAFTRLDDLARADPQLHLRGDLARAVPLGGRLRPPAAVPGDARRPGATRRLRPSGRPSARVRRVVTGALEIERASKRIGSSLEAAPAVYVADAALRAARRERSTSPMSASPRRSRSVPEQAPADAYRLDDVPGVAVVPARRRGAQMRAVLAHLAPRSAAIPSFPT